MKPRKPNVRAVHVSKTIELSTHLRRIVFTSDSFIDFPTGFEGSYVKVMIPQVDNTIKKRSYTIRTFNTESNELTLDFVINCHNGPATQWALNAKVGDTIGIAGPGPMKITNYQHHSYLLIADITSVNAINGYVPRFKEQADIRAIIVVPTRSDIIAMDYDDANNTTWFIEDETTLTLAEKVIEVSAGMSKDSHVFIGLEATEIRLLRPVLQEDIGFDRVNLSTVGYWKKGVDADRFGAQKKANPL